MDCLSSFILLIFSRRNRYVAKAKRTLGYGLLYPTIKSACERRIAIIAVEIENVDHLKSKTSCCNRLTAISQYFSSRSIPIALR